MSLPLKPPPHRRKKKHQKNLFETNKNKYKTVWFLLSKLNSVSGPGMTVRCRVSMIMCHSLTWLKTIIPKSMKEDYALYFCWSSLLKLFLSNITALFWFRVFGIRPISLNCLGATNEFVKWIYIHAKLINDYTDFRHKTITRCLEASSK